MTRQKRKTAPTPYGRFRSVRSATIAKARVYAQKIRRRYENLNSRNAKAGTLAENNAIIVYRSKLVNLTKNDAQKI